MTTQTADTTTNAYGALLDHVRECSLLSSSAEMLGWDNETMMPKGGLDYRSKQLALLARLTHERATADRLGGLIEEAMGECDADSPEGANVREIARDYSIATRLPGTLVEEMVAGTHVSSRDLSPAA